MLGLAVALPAQKRMGALGAALAQATDDAAREVTRAEMGRLQRRLAILGPILTGLLLLAAAGMAVARYVG